MISIEQIAAYERLLQLGVLDLGELIVLMRTLLGLPQKAQPAAPVPQSAEVSGMPDIPFGTSGTPTPAPAAEG